MTRGEADDPSFQNIFGACLLDCTDRNIREHFGRALNYSIRGIGLARSLSLDIKREREREVKRSGVLRDER